MSQPRRYAPSAPRVPSPSTTTVLTASLVALRNPYVRWTVGSHGVPPWPTDMEQWSEACVALHDRAQSALNRLEEESASWSDYERWTLEMERWLNLLTWGYFCVKTASEGPYEATSAAVDLAQKSYDTVYNGLARTPAFEVLERWTRPGHRGLSDDEKSSLSKAVTSWCGGAEKPSRRSLALVQEIRALSKRLESATERSKAVAPGVLVQRKSWVKLMPKPFLASASAHAVARGQDGWLFLPGTMEACSALAFVPDQATREALWRQENDMGFVADPAFKQTALRLRQARHEYALTKNRRNFAAYQMWGRAEESVARIDRFLSQGLKKMAPTVKKAYRALNLFARERLGLTALEPWDMLYATNHWRRTHNATKFARLGFPWLTTLHQAVPELMAIGGWMTQERDDSTAKEGVIRWTFRNHDGRKAHLLLDLFAHRDSDSGQSYGLRTTSEEPITIVHLGIDRRLNGFDHPDLVVLAHELGHVLHDLAVAHRTPLPSEEAFPWDAVEVPSHLLAQYAFDHRVLQRWASPTGPAKCRTAAYWRRYFKPDAFELIAQQENWYSSWVDLKLYSLASMPSLEVFDRKSRVALGLREPHPDDLSVYTFWTLEHYSAGAYAYTWADCLVELLVGQTSDGKTDGHAVGQAFVNLQDHVLRRVPAMGFNLAWKHAMGETAWQGALKGRDGFLNDQIKRTNVALAQAKG